LKIVLASASPRRRELLKALDIDFEVRPFSHEESYPESLPASEVAEYISREKADACPISPDELLITADTVVILDGQILGKPADDHEAAAMLRQLSGQSHSVVTGVTMRTIAKRTSFSVTTTVTFKPLTPREIDYYVSHYHPTDKAGAYGIQEWIGHIAVTELRGSYFNVMGLPVQRIYEKLRGEFGIELPFPF